VIPPNQIKTDLIDFTAEHVDGLLTLRLGDTVEDQVVPLLLLEVVHLLVHVRHPLV